MTTTEEVNASLTQEGLDLANVTNWAGRPKRNRNPLPKTYWEEYVETDNWYRKKLIEDVPADELWAALEDDDLEDDPGEEGDSEESGEDPEEMIDVVSDDILEDGEESYDASYEASDTDSESDEIASECGEEDEDV